MIRTVSFREVVKALTLAGLIGVSLLTALGASANPKLTLEGCVAAVALGAILRSPILAAGLLVASFFFTNYLNTGVGLLTPDKALGGLALLAWGIQWLTGRRRLVGVPPIWPLMALAAWLLASFTAARSVHAAQLSSLRYLIFFTVFFLVVQVVGGEPRYLGSLVDVMVGAAGIAGLLGLISVLIHHAYRSTGPIGDPNDFAFVLAASIPLIIHRVRWPDPRHPALIRGIATVSLLLAVGALLGTFSRGALLGLAVAAGWAIATRRIPLRWALTALTTAGIVVLLVLSLQPQVIHRSLQAKNQVAQTNVVTRLYFWKVAWREFQLEPITGVGPGNFEARFTDVAPYISGGTTTEAATNVDTTHNTYLNILAELGGPGLALFLIYLALSWRELRRRHPDRRTDDLQGALAAGFIASLVAAAFLTEQYFAPLWLLPALGACLSRPAGPGRAAIGSVPGGDSLGLRPGTPG